MLTRYAGLLVCGALIAACPICFAADDPGQLAVNTTGVASATASAIEVTITLRQTNSENQSAVETLDTQAKKLTEHFKDCKVAVGKISRVAVTVPDWRGGRVNSTDYAQRVVQLSMPLKAKDTGPVAMEAMEMVPRLTADLNDTLGEAVGGANENAAIASCKAFAEAEEIYRRTDYDGDGVLEYSQTIRGANSLFERTPGMGDLALVDKTFAEAEGNPSQKPTPKAGYCFKVLKAQGPNATGGKRDYVVKGNMTLGYALIAWPSRYGATGKNCFVINNNGTIFKKDLGVDTPKLVEGMTEYNPDQTWTVAEGGAFQQQPKDTPVDLVFKFSAPRADLLKLALADATRKATETVKLMGETYNQKEPSLQSVELSPPVPPTVEDIMGNLMRMDRLRGEVVSDQETLADEKAYSTTTTVTLKIAARFEFKTK